MKKVSFLSVNSMIAGLACLALTSAPAFAETIEVPSQYTLPLFQLVEQLGVDHSSSIDVRAYELSGVRCIDWMIPRKRSECTYISGIQTLKMTPDQSTALTQILIDVKSPASAYMSGLDYQVTSIRCQALGGVAPGHSISCTIEPGPTYSNPDE